MRRWIYVSLLRLHPRRFRERYREEMLEIFDEESARGRRALILDALASLFRQRVLRPAAQGSVLATVAWARPTGTPAFWILEDAPLRRVAWVWGTALTLLCFATVALAVNQSRMPGFLMGSRASRPMLFPVKMAASNATLGGPTREITMPAPEPDPLRDAARWYFGWMKVARALDADRDQTISTFELAAAAKALPPLDRDSDGVLDPRECGFSWNWRTGDTVLDLMWLHPLMAALDADRDGYISTGEMKDAETALRKLDRDRDSGLTPAEILPERILKRFSPAAE